MAQYFDNAESIRDFGRMVDQFSKLGKALAYAFGSLGFSKDEIIAVVGEGHYNTLDDKDTGFIHYGKHIAKPLSGLFGAFVFVHIPEMAFAQRLPLYLGQKGFKFEAKSGEVKASWFLDEVSFDFSEHTSRKERGQITLRNALHSDDIIIERGTSITASDNPRDWSPDYIGSYTFSIVDPNGVSVKPDIATKILWGSLGARGMKAYGFNSPQKDTLEIDGTDDDFTAEGVVIDCLKVLKKIHHVELMPKFNELVEMASTKLQQQPAMLECIVAAKLLGAEIIKAKRSLTNAVDGLGNKLISGNNGRSGYDQMETWERAVDNTTRILGIKLPDHLTSPVLLDLLKRTQHATNDTEKAISSLRKTANEKLCEEILPRLIVAKLVFQTPYPFDSCWLDAKSGNRIRTLPTQQVGPDNKDIAHKVVGILSEVNASTIPLVEQTVNTILTQNALKQTTTELKRMAEAFRTLSHHTGMNEAVLYKAASDAFNKIIHQIEKNPSGFICEDYWITHIERAHAVIHNRALRTNQKKLRISRARLANTRAFISLIKEVHYDFGQIIASYGKFPEFSLLTSSADRSIVSPSLRKDLLMAPTA